MIRPEFNKGDIVTFRAYPDQHIKAKVINVIFSSFGEDVRYRVEGVDQPLISETMGRSLVESKHFKCPIKYPFNWS